MHPLIQTDSSIYLGDFIDTSNAFTSFLVPSALSIMFFALALFVVSMCEYVQPLLSFFSTLKTSSEKED